MGRKTNVLAKKRLDKYYKLAKDEGYFSRAAFKLLQINREFNFLSECRCLVDLCAAPGGWTQVAAKHMPLSSVLVAVDLVKMKPIGGAKVLQGDIFTQKCRFAIKKELQGIPADAIIHDGAPNITGAWATDAYGQCNLVLASLKLATELLRQGGWFVTKVFRSADYNALLWVVQMFFQKVTVYKPIASRSSSAETYFVCQGYLAPKKIDPRLLDPKFVFREIEEKREGKSVMRSGKKKNNKNRDGYDKEGLLVNKANVMDLINSEKPEVILGEYHTFEFDDSPECQLLLSRVETNADVKSNLSDMQVLGKSDFRRLLKWRLKMVKFLAKVSGKTADESEAKAEPAKDVNSKTAEEIDEELDLKMQKEMKSIIEKDRREARNSQRKVRQQKIKEARTRHMGGIQTDDIQNWDTRDEQIGLFKMSNVVGAKELAELTVEGKTVELYEKYRGKKHKAKKKVMYASDSEDELLSEDEKLEMLYAKYKDIRGFPTKKEQRDRLRRGISLGSDDELSSGDDQINQTLDDMGSNSNSSNNSKNSSNANNSSSSSSANNEMSAGGKQLDFEEFERKRRQYEGEIVGKKLDEGGGLLMSSKDYEEVSEDDDMDGTDGSDEASDDEDGMESESDQDGDVRLEFKNRSKLETAKTWYADDIFDNIHTNDLVDQEQYQAQFGDLLDDAAEELEDAKQWRRSAKSGTGGTDATQGKKFKHRDLPDILRLPYRLQRKIAKNTRDKRRRMEREEKRLIERDALFEEVQSGINKTKLPDYVGLEQQARKLENRAKSMQKLQNSQSTALGADSDANALDDEDIDMAPKDGNSNSNNSNNSNNAASTDDVDEDGSDFEVVPRDEQVLNNLESLSAYYRSGVENALFNSRSGRSGKDADGNNVDYSDSEASDDSSVVAETLAIGKKMLCDKKRREEIVNASYNRWAFNDQDMSADGVQRYPAWFKDDEAGAYGVNIPVSRAEIREYKERMKAINAAPIKKVAEAKARKKLRAQRVWSKIKRQATSIAEAQDLSEKSKIKQIEKLYAKQGRKKKIEKVLMIGGKGRKPRPVGGKRPAKGTIKVTVDKRLKADKMGRKHAEKRGIKGKIKKSAKRQMARHDLRRKRGRRH